MTSLTASPPARPSKDRLRRDLPQGKLLRGYLHKTSNSLCGIKGYAGLIARKDQPQTSIVDWARKIICEVEKMESIYRSVGDLAQPSFSVGACAEVGRILLHAKEHCCRRFPLLSVTLPCLPECTSVLPAADLNQVIVELLANSAEGATGKEHPVSVVISWMSWGNKMALRVTDDGPGLDPVINRQALNPFVTTKSGHVGIGLNRVETILDMHGVDWTLNSTPGGGTTIVLGIAEMRNGLLEHKCREEGE